MASTLGPFEEAIAACASVLTYDAINTKYMKLKAEIDGGARITSATIYSNNMNALKEARLHLEKAPFKHPECMKVLIFKVIDDCEDMFRKAYTPAPAPRTLRSGKVY